VSAAAGATGSLAGQIPRLSGARGVGVTGSDDKNRLLRSRLGLGATVNHRSAALATELAAACPDGVDVYFDNVGGDVLKEALRVMNVGGPIVCCGAVAQYDGPADAPGPANVPTVLTTKRLTMQGFVVVDHAARFPEALDDLQAGVEGGELTGLEDVRDGLEPAPGALVDLLRGGNVGKLMIRVAPDPTD
jgi:NADPH-dependent curcumin reductase CurA